MKPTYVTIGKTTFNKEEALKLGYVGFKKAYSKIHKSTGLDDAWLALGGTIEKPKKQKEDAGKVE